MYSQHKKVVVTMVLGLTFLTTGIANADTKTVQPSYGMDRWITNTTPDTSYNADPYLWVAGINGSSRWKSYTRFDLSGQPVNATQVLLSFAPISADMSLTGVSWALPTQTWNSFNLNWNNQPGETLAGQTAAPTLGYWYTVDITSIYNNWRNGSSVNNGLSMSPVTTSNNADAFISSANTSYPGYRPRLTISYTPQADDSKPHLKWPLPTGYANRYVSGYNFGDIWYEGSCGGQYKKHVGVDYGATAGMAVYAAEDGYMRQSAEQAPWARNLVIEHTKPDGSKYTTVYWHINPTQYVLNNYQGGFIAKGTLIGTIAPLSTGSHLHLGIRMQTYDGFSGVGALPQQACDGYPAFSSNFITTASSQLIFN